MNTLKIIDADAHMLEPPGLWTEGLNQRFRDRAPRIVKDPDGRKGLFFICEQLPPLRVSGAFAAGKTFDKKFLEAGLDSAPAGGWDPAARLKDMELDGVEAAVLYTTMGFVLFWIEDAEFQQDCFRVYNDWLAEFCSYAPGRFAGLAMISLFDIDRARRELERCAKMGLKGALIWASPPEDRPYTQRAYDPFWAAAQEMGILILFHPYDEQPATGLSDYFLHNCIGYPLQTTIAAVRMMFSGVFMRFAALRMRLPHAGGFLPFQIERFRHAADFRPEPRSRGFTGDPLDVLKRLYYDTVTFSPMTLRYLVDLVGADRLLLGSDFPFEMGDPDPVGTVKAAIAPEHQDGVLGGTLARLLCLDSACACS